MLPELSFWVIKSNWPAKNNILKVLPGILGIKVGSVCLWGLKMAQDNLILDLQCSIVFFPMFHQFIAFYSFLSLLRIYFY